MEVCTTLRQLLYFFKCPLLAIYNYIWKPRILRDLGGSNTFRLWSPLFLWVFALWMKQWPKNPRNQPEKSITLWKPLLTNLEQRHRARESVPEHVCLCTCTCMHLCLRANLKLSLCWAEYRVDSQACWWETISDSHDENEAILTSSNPLHLMHQFPGSLT